MNESFAATRIQRECRHVEWISILSLFKENRFEKVLIPRKLT